MKNNKPQKNIPAGWQEVRLADIGSFSKGAGILKDQLTENGHNAVRYGELYTRHNFHIKKIYSHIPSSVVSTTKKIKYGDILFAGSGETIDEIGKSAAYLLKEDCYAGGDIIVFSPKNADSLFLAYFLNIGEGRKKLSELGQGQSVVHIYKSEIEKMKLHLPSLPEQKRIVAVLESWDGMVSKLARKIAVKKNIKKGLMQNLLTGKVRLAGFNDKWNTFMFGDIAEPRKERFDPKKYKTTKPCIELEHIKSNAGKLCGKTHTTESSSMKTIFHPGDILFGKLRAYLRKYWLATYEGVCSTEIWVLNANRKKTIPEIIFQIVQSERFISIATTSQGTHMPRSTWNFVAEYEVQLPEIREQKAIADILVMADREIKKLEEKLKIIQGQKKFLLNNLITGQIRVPEKHRIKKELLRHQHRSDLFCLINSIT